MAHVEQMAIVGQKLLISILLLDFTSHLRQVFHPNRLCESGIEFGFCHILTNSEQADDLIHVGQKIALNAVIDGKNPLDGARDTPQFCLQLSLLAFQHLKTSFLRLQLFAVYTHVDFQILVSGH